MKKKTILSLALLLTIAVAGLCSCNGCKNNGNVATAPELPATASVYHDYDGVIQDFTAGTAKIQALHRQTMFSTLGIGEYEWRNSRIVFSETVTFDNIDDLHVIDVIDVFCYWKDGMWVQYINSNVERGLQIPWPINDVWIEDANLSDKPVKLSAEDAIGRLKEWNGVLPRDCNFITLRLPVGPKDCNPQWVFGDVYDVLFIDAVTGEVTDSNPAF